MTWLNREDSDQSDRFFPVYGSQGIQDNNPVEFHGDVSNFRKGVIIIIIGFLINVQV